jgi:four helix bundle protein
MGAYDEVQLEHERLEVYGLALRLHAASCALVPRRELRTLRDQLERASLGIVLNVAEGAGRRSGPDKRRFYEMARGSATETAAIIDVLKVRSLAPAAACAEARTLAVRVVQILSKLTGPARDPQQPEPWP